MQDNDPFQDYECECGRKLEHVKAFQIKQHRESPACREARLHILSQNFMAERVQAVPSDFAFEEESNPPPVAEADPCVGPAEEVMVEVDDTGFATCPGFCPEQLTPQTFYKLYPFAIHTPGGIPNCPPISWLPGHNVVFSVACDGTMHGGEKCCEFTVHLVSFVCLRAWTGPAGKGAGFGSTKGGGVGSPPPLQPPKLSNTPQGHTLASASPRGQNAPKWAQNGLMSPVGAP